MQYDLAIIGGGPAGVAAGVYAARKQLKTVLIAKTFGGQSIDSLGIENWIGDIKVSGIELAQKLEKHVNAYAGEYVDIKKGQEVAKIEKVSGGFKVSTKKESFDAKTILIATGSNRRPLPALNADKFENKGLTYCATCDGPLFKGQEVAVVGGGNSALEAVMQLLAYCPKVYLIHRRDSFRADPVTVENIKKDSKLEIMYNTEVVEILGDKMVSGLKYKNSKTGEEKELKIGGIFVEIGAIPIVYFAEGLVDMTDEKTIKIDPWTQRTSVEGIWAAGDVTDVKYHQNNIAAGDAVLALEDIYTYIKSQ